MERIELSFALERETKNTYRYAEIAEPGAETLGTIYVQKAAMRRAGSAVPPPKLLLAIEPAAGATLKTEQL